MIKKGFFIAASLMIVGCGVKNNGNNNANNSQNTQPPVDKVEDFTPPKKEEAPMDNLPPDWKPMPEPKPIPEPKPDFKPEPKPDVKPDPNANVFLQKFDKYSYQYKISDIFTDKFTDENNESKRYTANTSNNNFILTVKKADLNTLIYTFEGSITLISYDRELANINCNKRTVQKVYYNKEGIKPYKIENIENGCTYSENLMSPLINYNSFKGTFLAGIENQEQSNIGEIPRLKQLIQLKPNGSNPL